MRGDETELPVAASAKLLSSDRKELHFGSQTELANKFRLLKRAKNAYAQYTVCTIHSLSIYGICKTCKKLRIIFKLSGTSVLSCTQESIKTSQVGRMRPWAHEKSVSFFSVFDHKHAANGYPLYEIYQGFQIYLLVFYWKFLGCFCKVSVAWSLFELQMIQAKVNVFTKRKQIFLPAFLKISEFTGFLCLNQNKLSTFGLFSVVAMIHKMSFKDITLQGGKIDKNKWIKSWIPPY